MVRQLVQQSIKPALTPPNQKWLIYLGRKIIGQVYRDPKATAGEVYNGLVFQEGMCQDIKVFKKGQ